MKKIFVTGGAGYIGSHICKALHQQGFDPITFDSLEKGHRWAVKWGELITGDLKDLESIENALLTHKPDAVIHCASYIEVGESVKNPELYYQNNVGGAKNLLCAMEKAGVNKFIFSGTAAVYGNPDSVPVTEEHELKPINPYGQYKLEVEELLKEKSQSGLQAISLRYFNACGADRDAEIGEAHDPESHLIPNILLSVLKGKNDFSIFGRDYPTPDGTCIRDYVHVEDLASAHLLALSHLKGSQFETFNIGSGHGFSNLEIFNAVKKVTQKEIQLQFSDRRAGDPPKLIASSEKIRRVLNWKPQWNSIEQIIESAWKFTNKFHNSL